MIRKIFRKRLIVAGLLAGGLIAGAYAMGPGDCGPMMGHPMMNPEKMQEYMAKRQAELKTKLKLQPQQEGAWNAYVEAMKPSQTFDRKKRDEMRAEMDKLTTPQRIDKMQEMADQHRAQMQKRNEATKAFYAALNPEQQKIFDDEAQPMRHRMRGGHGG